MPIVDILISLVAYCQNQGVLSTDSNVYQEIAEIAMCDVAYVEEVIG